MSERIEIQPNGGAPAERPSPFEALRAMRNGGDPAAAGGAPQPSKLAQLIEQRQAQPTAADPARQRLDEPPAAPAPAAPAAPQRHKVKFRHQDVELDEADLVKYAQKGMSAAKLEEQRQKFEQEKRDLEARVGIVQNLERLAQVDPARYQAVIDAMHGRAPQRGLADDGVQDLDEPILTGNRGAPNVNTAMEQRIAALEAQLQQTAQTFHQKDYETRASQALSSQAYIRQNPEAGEVARSLLDAALAAREFDTPEEAAPIIAAKVRRIAEAHMESERKARQSAQDASMPRTPSGSPNIPRIDPKNLTREARRNGTSTKALQGLVNAFRQQFSGTNQLL
jgi:hypothetical protein